MRSVILIDRIFPVYVNDFVQYYKYAKYMNLEEELEQPNHVGLLMNLQLYT